ncbi:MAG: VWA domain-containing protein [Desulfobacteraceae bacterium]|nr:VWA domain-containing protein [Desulfobacteraceae bacterium]
MFRFASPLFLLLLLVLLIILLIKVKKKQTIHLKVSSLSLGNDLPESFFLILSKILPTLKYVALVLLIIGMARPQSGTQKIETTSKGINIILALDLSGSMAALDFKINNQIVTRLAAVKNVVKDFILKRDGDRIGMVVFGSNAFTQLPLTRDYNTISFMLSQLKIGAAGQSTAIGDAIGISLKRLKDVKSKSNIIILLTDGKSNAGEISPEIAADIAQEQKVKIYTVGVGSKGKAPFLVRNAFTGNKYVYQKVDIDIDMLKLIAEKTNGEFFKAENTKSLDQIYNMIDQLEKTEVKIKKWIEYKEYYLFFLTSGFALLCVYILLSNTRLLRIP